jgi:hypothetical protein
MPATNTAELSLRLAPCIDKDPHHFAHTDGPAPGNFGYVVIYCTRCGATRPELIARAYGIDLAAIS